MELLPSPWNPENLIITVLGNSPLGVSWAADALLDESARPKLIGNFAVVTDEQVISIDTRLFANENDPASLPAAVIPSDVIATDVASTPTGTRTSASALLPIALVVTVFLIFVVIGIALYTNRKSKLTPNKK